MTVADFTTYAELQTRVAEWLNRDNLTTQIPRFIALTEQRMLRDLKVKGFEQVTTYTADGDETIALTTGFIHLRALASVDQPHRKMHYLTPEQMNRMGIINGNSSDEWAYTIVGDNLEIRPTPESGDTFRAVEFVELTPLSDGNTTNWFVTNAADALLYGCLMEGFLYIENPRMHDRYKEFYTDAVLKLRDRDRKKEQGSGQLEIRPAVMPKGN